MRSGFIFIPNGCPSIKRPLLGDRYRRGSMSDFTEDDQVRLIAQGLENSVASRGPPDCARCVPATRGRTSPLFAQRGAAASRSTPSYFAPHLNGACRLPSDPELSHPVCLEGIIEVPITWFRDGLDRIRPAQLCACSIGEFEHILNGCLEPWLARGNPVAAQFRAGSAPIARATAKGHASARSSASRALPIAGDKQR